MRKRGGGRKGIERGNKKMKGERDMCIVIVITCGCGLFPGLQGRNVRSCTGTSA